MTLLMMTSTSPYLLRAIHQWLIDNNDVPYILVNTEVFGVNVPLEYIEDNKIVLNISYDAVDYLEIDNKTVCFSARFGTKSVPISVPINAVLSIYGQNSSEGLVLSEPNDTNITESKPNLRLV